MVRTCPALSSRIRSAVNAAEAVRTWPSQNVRKIRNKRFLGPMSCRYRQKRREANQAFEVVGSPLWHSALRIRAVPREAVKRTVRKGTSLVSAK